MTADATAGSLEEPGSRIDGPRRRHAAGADPAKRDQILAGARRVFMERGFDAASMSEVGQAANVSKGTLYVYFDGKEDLFEALVERQRERLFEGIEAILDGDAPLPERLGLYGRRLAGIVCSDEVVRAQRIVIGIAERMPDLAARFYDLGAGRAQAGLRRALAREVEGGRLAIPDVALAAQQFSEMAMAGLWRPRLFGKALVPPSPAAIDACVDGAVAMLLALYGRDGS